jgi:GntR family transcriptional repressor for pyruvate dehydrogenase complex
LPTSRRIYEDIADTISRQIGSGELADGQLLPSERTLAQTFGASRASVREALLSLQSSGLVSMRQRARARVTRTGDPAVLQQLSGITQNLGALPNGVADFQEARVLFECGLARYAARHASKREIDRLAAALARNKKALRDPTAFAETDVAFHNVLAEIPRNPIFLALNSALSEWLMAQRTVGIRAPVRGTMRAAYRGHVRVFEAIAARDAEAADKAMGHHLDIVSRYYWKGMAAQAK